jgi:hypothetical protein
VEGSIFWHSSALAALTHVLGGVFAVSQDARTGSLMLKATTFASTLTKSSHYHGPGLPFYAMLTSFCEVKKAASPAKKFWKHYFELKSVTADSANALLEVAASFLKYDTKAAAFTP